MQKGRNCYWALALFREAIPSRDVCIVQSIFLYVCETDVLPRRVSGKASTVLVIVHHKQLWISLCGRKPVNQASTRCSLVGDSTRWESIIWGWVCINGLPLNAGDVYSCVWNRIRISGECIFVWNKKGWEGWELYCIFYNIFSDIYLGYEKREAKLDMRNSRHVCLSEF